MGDNGQAADSKKKWCPFLDQYCLEGRCALYATFTKRQAGLAQQIGACSFVATNMLLSEINVKTVVKQQPGLMVPRH